MVLYSRARKENKKLIVLEAVAKHGSIVAAAKASRVSRDAVNDWRHNDPAFASAFLIAKAAFKNKPETLTINDAIDFFTAAIQPYVPAVLWPRIHSRIQIAASERKFKAHGNAGSAVPSRNQVSAPPFNTGERRATSFVNDGALHRSF